MKFLNPTMVGLMERFGRQIAGKCVEGGDRHRNYPRYVATKAAFHLLGTSSGIKIDRLAGNAAG